MRIQGAVLVTLASILTASCGAVGAASPTGPSPAASGPAPAADPSPAPSPATQGPPSLIGQWQASGTRIVFRNRETGTSPGVFNCEGSLSVGAQSGNGFSGGVNTSGHGWNSDRFCTFSGMLSGEMVTPDGGTARGRLDGRFSSNQCTFVSGDGVFTGRVAADTISLEAIDILRCPVNLDGGPGMPVVEFERTVTLAFVRR